ncbi:MAG: hypothetical protein Tsb0034_18470 [Ekhidna sp.]
MILGIISISFYSVHLGRDGSLIEWLSNKDNYYFDLLFALTVTGSVWLSTRAIILQLDQKGYWGNTSLPRVAIQLLITLFVSAIIQLLLGILYSFLLLVEMEKIMAIDVELMVGLLFTVLVNLVYIILALYAKSVSNTPEISLLGKSGISTRRLDVDSISYFLSKNKIVYAIDRNGRSLITEYTLDELETKLNRNFFRLNRQIIASKEAIIDFQNTKTRRLLIRLNHPPKKDVFVSQQKSSDFKSWIQND